MKWDEVFDKYFLPGRRKGGVLVFIPGTYDGNSIHYAWTTLTDIDNGLDFSSLSSTRYGLYGEEKETVPSIFKNWKPMKTFSQEERVCKKIRVMEERWKRFQAAKKPPEKIMLYKY